MKGYIRRARLGALALLSILACVCPPASVSADNVGIIAVSTPAPDLVIQELTWSPETPSVGDTVIITVTIKNQGSAQAGSSRVSYYLNDVYKASASVDPVLPDSTKTKTFTWTAEAGSYTIKAVADANSNIDEIDETNNVTNFAFSVLAPDLIVEAITWTPQSPSVGDSVNFTITIRNHGNEQARFSRAELFVDAYSLGYEEVQRIDAGANTTATFSWTAREGLHTVEADIDILNQVKESDETNNIKKVTYATAVPDLIIQDITWTPEDLLENSLVNFFVTIKNQGSGKADHSYVSCYIDDMFETSIWINKLDIDATATVNFTWGMRIGSHTVKAVADSMDRLLEVDEDNNAKSVVLPTMDPDLYIENISWSPFRPLLKHRIVLTVTVRNQGKTEACTSTLDFAVDSYHKRVSIPAIAAGTTITKSLEWTMRKETHILQAFADTDNCVIESDESNNLLVETLSVFEPDTYELIVQDITWSPENPAIGDEMTFSVVVENKGSGSNRPFHVAYYLDDTYMTSDYIEQMGAGATNTQTFIWTAAAGEHDFKAVVDINEGVPETNETNNEKVVTFSVPSPDLVIQGITWSPLVPVAGDMITFTVSVKNRGEVLAGPSSVAYYVDGSYRGSHSIQEIDIGATLTTSFTWMAQADSHFIRVVADAENRVSESNESNNERIANLPAPDLVVQDVIWSPSSPSENTTVTFMATVKNHGGSEAGPSRIYFYVDGSLEGSDIVQALNVGDNVMRTFTLKEVAGSYTVKVVADGDNDVTESNESNNEKTADFQVFLLPPSTPVSNSEPVNITTTGFIEPEEGVHFRDATTDVPLGKDIILSFSAGNPSTNPVMTVQMVIQLPSGISIISPEFDQGEKERYSASYSVEPGDLRQIDVRMKADQEGRFNVMADLSYYLGEDKSLAEHQIMTLPISVGTEEASGDSQSTLSMLKGIFMSWWFILALVVLVGAAVVLLRRRHRRLDQNAG